MSVCPPISLIAYLSVCLRVCRNVELLVWDQTGCLFVGLSAGLSVCLTFLTAGFADKIPLRHIGSYLKSGGIPGLRDLPAGKS